jgi:hypothetical protein
MRRGRRFWWFQVKADSEGWPGFAAKLRFLSVLIPALGDVVESFGDGANFPGLVVARRSKIPDIRRSSLLDPDKFAYRRCRPKSANRP